MKIYNLKECPEMVEFASTYVQNPELWSLMSQ
jgi:hypothetical protein